MSQLSLSLDSSLLLRDDRGRYRLATADQSLEAVRQVIARCADHLAEPVKHYRHTPLIASLLMGPQN